MRKIIFLCAILAALPFLVASENLAPACGCITWDTDAEMRLVTSAIESSDVPPAIRKQLRHLRRTIQNAPTGTRDFGVRDRATRDALKLLGRNDRIRVHLWGGGEDSLITKSALPLAQGLLPSPPAGLSPQSLPH